ncbi:MAG: glycosyltransferase family 9 protein [Thiobacillus sp.]|nr:glycosyltransferase family 9 protein [Thiobacillus sp.]
MKRTSSRSGVLVIQPLPGIGDMVWHLPHLAAIAAHEPEGRVSVLTKPRSLSDQLLAGTCAVEKVHWINRPGAHSGLLGFFRLVAMLRRARYRKVWLLHDSARYAVASVLAGIPQRTGIADGWQRLLFNVRPLRPVPRNAHTVERADHLLAGLGITVDRTPPMLRARLIEREALHAAAASCPRPWFCVGIGSSEAFKQWGEENFSRLTSLLASRHGGTIFLLGGRSEAAMAAALVAHAPPNARLRAWIQQPLQRVIALLADSRLFLGNDTGMLNLAAACGTPSVGLFGHPVSAWVAQSSPCIHPVYPDTGLSESGVRSISVEAVMQRVDALLAEPHAQRPD